MAKNATIGIGELEWKEESLTRTVELKELKKWYVLWTHSHYEQIVFDQLHRKGLHPFFPKLEMWSKRGGNRYRSSVPMFPGYIFLHHMMDKMSYVEILNTIGLARILGKGWGQFATVPDPEIEAIEKSLQAQLTVVSHPYLREGQRVRVTDGPLMGVEGILVDIKPKKGLLILSVSMLQRSVAVELDCTQVRPA